MPTWCGHVDRVLTGADPRRSALIRSSAAPVCAHLPLDVAENFGKDSTDTLLEACRPRLLVVEEAVPLNLPATRGLARASGARLSMWSSWPVREWRPLPSLLTGLFPGSRLLWRVQSMDVRSRHVRLRFKIDQSPLVLKSSTVNTRSLATSDKLGPGYGGRQCTCISCKVYLSRVCKLQPAKI